MNNYFLAVCFFILLILSVGFVCFAEHSTFSGAQATSILSTLLAVSSIVFAIVGAWIAIIYPSAIKSFYVGGRQGLKKEAESNGMTLDQLKIIKNKEMEDIAKNITDLINIVMISSFVLVATLVIQVIQPVLASFNYIGIPLSIIKGFALFTLLSLTLIQINAILLVARKNFEFWKEVKDVHKAQKII